MVELGSDVPLREDIIKRPIEFVKTWVEWSAKNRLQINKSKGVSGLIFTVPDNNTLWITTAFCSLIETSGSAESAVEIGSSGGSGIVKLISASSTATGEGNNAISFPMPIKVEQKLQVRAVSNGTTAGTWGFTGFVEPNFIT